MPEVEVGDKRTGEAVDDFVGDSYKKKPRAESMQIRLLLVGRCCGGIIGKGGENISKLRKEYNVDVQLPATRTSDRVFTIEGDVDDCVAVVREILPFCGQAPYPVNQKCAYELNILTHTEYVGTVIGKGGSKIKEIREQSHGKIKVYQDCLPLSDERVVAIGGDTEEQIISAVKIILYLLKDLPKRTCVLYDPVNKSNEDAVLPLPYMQKAWSNDGGGGKGMIQLPNIIKTNYDDDMQFSECSETNNFRWNKKDSVSNPDVYQHVRVGDNDGRKTKEQAVLDQALSVLQLISENQEKPNSSDESFGQMIGLTLKNIPEKRVKEYAKIRIQEILYQAEFGLLSDTKGGSLSVGGGGGGISGGGSSGGGGGTAPQYVERTQVQQTVYSMSPPRNPQYSEDRHHSIQNYTSHSLPSGGGAYYNNR